MPDLRTRIDREARRIHAASDALPSVLRAGRRRARRHQAISIVGMLALAGAAFAGLLLAWNGDRAPAPSGPAPEIDATSADRLQEAWRSTLDAASVGPAAFSAGSIWVGTEDGRLIAFRKSCAPACGEPRWVADVDAPIDSVVVDNGTGFVRTEDQVVAYPTDCGPDGAECPALWRADVGEPAGPPIERHPFVYVTGRGADGTHLFAVRVTCAEDGSVCEPAWSAPLPAPASAPTTVRGGIAVTTTSGIRVYPIACREDPCTRFRRVTTSDRTIVLVQGDQGRSWVDGPVSDGRRLFQLFEGNWTSFRPSCWLFRSPRACATVSSAPVIGGTDLMLGDGVVVVTDERGVARGYRAACGTPCSPMWEVWSGIVEPIPATIHDDIVAIGSRAGIRLHPAICRDDRPCDWLGPTLSLEGVPPSRVRTPSFDVEGRSLVVTTGNEVEGVVSVWTVDGVVPEGESRPSPAADDSPSAIIAVLAIIAAGALVIGIWRVARR